MIELFINKLPADLPADFSFSMEYENEFFTKASEYSLDIELPLLGSPNNQKIFGNIHRVTTPKSNVNYEAVAYVNGRCVSHGYALILSVTDKSVKIQLVGNTSYVNYLSTDTFIDEMNLGYRVVPEFDDLTYADMVGTAYIKQNEYHKIFGSIDDVDGVYFWAYYKDPKDIADSTFWLQRYPNSPFPTFSVDDKSSQVWLKQMYLYSVQPYLICVIERVIGAMGFRVRRNDINQTWLRNLYICNYEATKLFDGYGEIRRALPHWSISTFISEVEKLCACIFIFNTYNKTVDIIQLDKFYGDMAEIYAVPDDCILDEYEFEFSDNESDKDLSTGNISFSKDYTDKYLKFSEEVKNTIETHNHYTNYDELVSSYNNMAVIARQNVLFIDDDTGREYICYLDEDGNDMMKEVNIWADFIREDGGGGDVSLRIVPANTRLFDIGWFYDFDSGRPSLSLTLNVPFSEQEQTTNPEHTTAQAIIENSYSNERRNDSNDCMEVMLSTGQWYHLATYNDMKLSYPAPFVDFNMECTGKGKFPKMSLSLKDVCEQSLGHMYRNIPSYRSDQKFVFRFLAKIIPDARKPFRFHNQLFVCRKLNADFSHSTKDLVFEGEFYRLE